MFVTSQSRIASALLALLGLVGCQTQSPKPTPPTAPEATVMLKEQTFRDLPPVDETHWETALATFLISCQAMKKNPLWQTTCESAAITPNTQAAIFFDNAFTPYRVIETDATPETGLMTGYYEPMLDGSLTPTSTFRYPIYRTPDDLIIVDLASLYPQLQGMRLRGKLEGRRLVPYDDRAGIEARAEELKPYVIAYVNDPVEALFLQIQGSGRIRLPDGELMRVGYADQNGHPYKAIGKWLLDRNLVSRDQLSMQTIQAWAKAHPKQTGELLESNPSYVFFEVRKDHPELGPRGAQNVPLTPESSVAVDRTIWTYGLPFVVEATQSNPALTLRQPVIAQDTGGAIRGANRFDFFWGFGHEAGRAAGRQKSQTQAWVLIPKGKDPASFMKTKPVLL